MDSMLYDDLLKKVQNDIKKNYEGDSRLGKRRETLYDDVLGDMLKQAENDIKTTYGKPSKKVIEIKRRETFYEDVLGSMLKQAEDDIKKAFKTRPLTDDVYSNDDDDMPVKHKLPYQLIKKYLNKVIQEVHFTNGFDKLDKDDQFCLLYKSKQIEVPCIGVDVNNLDVGENVLLDIDPESTKLPFFCKMMIVNQGKTHERSTPILVRDVCLQIGESYLDRPNAPLIVKSPRQHSSRYSQQNDPNVSYATPLSTQRARTCSWSNMEEYYSIPHYQYKGKRKYCVSTGVNTYQSIAYDVDNDDDDDDVININTTINNTNNNEQTVLNCSMSIDTNDLIDYLNCKNFSKIQLMSPYALNKLQMQQQQQQQQHYKSILAQPSELRVKKRKKKHIKFSSNTQFNKNENAKTTSTTTTMTLNLNSDDDNTLKNDDEDEFYMIRDMATDTDDFIFYLSKYDYNDQQLTPRQLLSAKTSILLLKENDNSMNMYDSGVGHSGRHGQSNQSVNHGHNQKYDSNDMLNDVVDDDVDDDDDDEIDDGLKSSSATVMNDKKLKKYLLLLEKEDAAAEDTSGIKMMNESSASLSDIFTAESLNNLKFRQDSSSFSSFLSFNKQPNENHIKRKYLLNHKLQPSKSKLPKSSSKKRVDIDGDDEAEVGNFSNVQETSIILEPGKLVDEEEDCISDFEDEKYKKSNLKPITDRLTYILKMIENSKQFKYIKESQQDTSKAEVKNTKGANPFLDMMMTTKKEDRGTQVTKDDLYVCFNKNCDRQMYAIYTGGNSDVVCSVCKLKLTKYDLQKKINDVLMEDEENKKILFNTFIVPSNNQQPNNEIKRSMTDTELFNLLSENTRNKYFNGHNGSINDSHAHSHSHNFDNTQNINKAAVSKEVLNKYLKDRDQSDKDDLDHYFRLHHDKTLKMYLEPLPTIDVLQRNINDLITTSPNTLTNSNTFLLQRLNQLIENTNELSLLKL